MFATATLAPPRWPALLVDVYPDGRHWIVEVTIDPMGSAFGCNVVSARCTATGEDIDGAEWIRRFGVADVHEELLGAPVAKRSRILAILDERG